MRGWGEILPLRVHIIKMECYVTRMLHILPSVLCLLSTKEKYSVFTCLFWMMIWGNFANCSPNGVRAKSKSASDQSPRTGTYTIFHTEGRKYEEKTLKTCPWHENKIGDRWEPNFTFFNFSSAYLTVGAVTILFTLNFISKLRRNRVLFFSGKHALAWQRWYRVRLR